MSFQVVIPARYASSRLPGKPLADIAGQPMVVRVLERCLQSRAEAVWVATDDARIAEVVTKQGGQVLMTRADHVSGTDRLEEVATQLALPDDAILVNVQGDEPLIPPEVINQVAHNLQQQPDCAMATLCEPVTQAEEVFNPNLVKVVMDKQGRALYFSRAPMPWRRGQMPATGELPAGIWWRHIGIYAYRVGLLHQFVSWPVGHLEAVESLEQLRVMENGNMIHVAEASQPVPGGVDTADDLARIQKVFV